MNYQPTQNVHNYNNHVPFNTEAEMFVLGSIFIDNNILDSITGKIIDTDFYDQKNQFIYRAMLALHKNDSPIEYLTVIEELTRQNYNDIESIKKYIVELIDGVPSTAAVDLYIDVVEEKAIERKLLATINGISQDIIANKFELNDILDRTENEILSIIKQRRSSDFMMMPEAADKVFDKINSFIGRNTDITGLDTGYKNLNRVTLGFQKGDLMILAARPAVGKSTLAINLALNIASINNAHVALFSLEMSIEQLLMRMYSQMASVSLNNIRSGNLSPEDVLLLSNAKAKMHQLNVYFDVSTSTNISDIRNKCRQLKQQGKLDFVVIDYLQLITASNSRGNRQEEVSQISRQLKRIAQELEVPVLALSQLSRSLEGREDKRPQLADLRESGSIEQDADMVMFIYRRSDVEEQPEADQLQAKVEELAEGDQLIKLEEKKRERMIEVIVSIAKNRQGPLEDFDYQFYGNFCRFKECENFRKLVIKKKQNNGMHRLNSVGADSK